MSANSAEAITERPRSRASRSSREPRGKIDGRTDYREVEPATAANIPVEHLADMQRQAEGQLWRALRR